MSLIDPRNAQQDDAQASIPGKSVKTRRMMSQAVEPTITDTATFTAKAIADVGAFRVSTEEQSATLVGVESIDPGQDWYQPIGDLCEDYADSAIMLVLPKETLAQELEALAVSLFTDAMWSAPGQLRVHHKAYLHGPFRVTSEMSDLMQTRKIMQWAYIFECPPMREGPLPPELRGLNFFDDIFHQAVPGGLEREVLDTLIAFATRLRGQIIVHHDDKYHRLTPDPDSYVNLRVYAPEFLYPKIALELLCVAMPGVQIIADTTGTVKPPSQDQSDAFKATGFPSYALQADAGKDTQFFIDAYLEEYIPPALRWETWIESDVFVYNIYWQPSMMPSSTKVRMSRSQRIQRAQSSRVIEQAAVALAVLSNGVILDEGGFIVGYDYGE